MIDWAALAPLIGGATPFLVAIFAWATNRGLNARKMAADERAAAEKAYQEKLASQREDFRVLIDPLQTMVDRLQEQQDDLREEVRESNILNRQLLRDLDRVLAYFRLTYKDEGPSLSLSVQAALDAAKGA